MARALLGHISSGADQALSFEITRLRRRVAALEAELAELRDAQPSVPASLEIELHQLAEHAARARLRRATLAHPSAGPALRRRRPIARPSRDAPRSAG